MSPMGQQKIVLTAGVRPMVTLAFCDHHPLHCAFLAEQDHPQEAVGTSYDIATDGS
jgi:hypothetical protein